MTFRWNWLCRGNMGGVGKGSSDLALRQVPDCGSGRRARRKAGRNQRQAGFFERLEDRLVLNGIAIAKPDASYSTPVDTALVVTGGNHPLLENDWDPEGDSLTASVVTNPAHGSISSFSSSTGTFTYTPDSSYTGIDTFTYQVNDGTDDSDTVTVAIAVGGHFGPRTNLAEVPLAMTGGCSASSALLPLSASCLTGDLEFTQRLTPDVALVYNSGTLPEPIIVLETFLQSASSVPDEIKAKLTFNGTAGTEYSYSTSGLAAGNSLRFALQADATSLATGRYAYTVQLTARFGGGNVTRDYSGYALVVNRASSSYEFGRGWQLTGLDKLVSATGGMMLVRSTGDALWFADDGSGGYERASGDDSFATLEKHVDNTFTLTDNHGIQANFSAAGLLTSRVDRNDNTTNFTYSSGLLTQVSDPFDRDINLTYTSGRLTSVTDFASRTASLSYTSGNLTSVTQPDPDGAGTLASPVWDFAYDATSHRLTQVEDPLNQDTDFAYGTHERLTSITHEDSSVWELTALQTIGLPTGTSGNSLTAANPLGNVEDERNHDWTYRTDRFGRLTEWNNPLSHQTLYQRNGVGLPIKLTEADPDGGGSLISPVTVFGYDSSGNLTYQKNPDNSTRTWTYSTSFNLALTATDELGRVSEYAYDTAGNLTTFTDPAENDTTFAYNSLGLVTSKTTPDPDGAGSLTAAVTEYDYDAYGRLETITYADDSTRVYTYNTADQVIDDEDELGHSATFTYDALGRQTSATNREAAVTSYEYNALGLVTKLTDALGNETDYEYNNRNLRVTVTYPDPDGAGSLSRPEIEYGYDAVGNMISEGVAYYTIGHPIEYTFDEANRRTRTRKVLGTEHLDTDFTYDNLGRVTKVTDPLDHDTSYEYSSRGWMTKMSGHNPGTQSLQPVTEYAYDLAGQRTSITDPRGFVTSFTYDVLGLLATETLPDPDGAGPLWAPTTFYSYDNLGRLTLIEDPLCRFTHYEYDSRDRLIGLTLPDPDNNGSLTAPETTFGYDDAGRRTSVTDPLARVTTYTFDDVGRVLTTTLPDPDGAGALSAPVTTTIYDALGNVTSVTDPRGKVTSYTYDHLQRRTTVTEPDPDGGGSLSSPVTTLVYGGQGLVTITDPLGHDTTFGYDGLGRKITSTDHQSHQTSYEYDFADRLVGVTLPDPDGGGAQTASETTYDYDDYNRLITIIDPLSGSTSFTYDKADHLLSVEDPEGNVTSYAYDNIGQLAIETNELDDARSFAYDPTGNLARRTDRNGRVRQFVRDDLNRITSEQWYSDGTPTPSLSIATTTEGGPANEVQRVGFSVSGGNLSGGTFTLTFNGATTTAIAHSASAATVQSALESLSTIGTGNVVVTKLQNNMGAQEWGLTFQGTLSATNVVQTTVNSSAVTYSGTLSNIQATDTTGGTNSEVQTVTLSNAAGGTLRLAFRGEITPPLDWDATATEIETALENLNTVDQVTVTGSAGGPWTVAFAGTHAGLNVAKLNGDTANVTNGTLERVIGYVYDAANQLTSVSDADSDYDYTYDNLGRLLTVDTVLGVGLPTPPHVILTNAYDATGNRTSLSATIGGTNDFLNTYTYDALNRLTRVDQTGQTGGNTVAEKRVDFAYNSLGQFTEIARFKDTDGGTSHEIATSTYSYDTLNRLTGLAYKKNSSNLFTPYSYTYDGLSSAGVPNVSSDPRVAALARGAVFSGAGRITQMTSADGTSDYTYDKTSQLTGADHSYQTDETYTYDSNGNRTMTGYVTGANNQLLEDGTYEYEYDAEGNRARRVKTADDTSTEYDWDFRNRLIHVTDKDATEDITQVVEYKYDVFDRRISRAVDTTSPFDLEDAAMERYVLDDINGVNSADGGNVVLDFVDPDGPDGETEIALAKRYLYGNQVDQLLAQEDVTEAINSASRVLWPLVDNLQTVRDLHANDANSAEHFEFSSFGQVVDGDTSLTRYLHTSRDYESATSLQYNRARWKDPVIGRWMGEDPLNFIARDSSLSRYVGNSAPLHTDPSGLKPHLRAADRYIIQAYADYGTPIPSEMLIRKDVQTYMQWFTNQCAKLEETNAVKLSLETDPKMRGTYASSTIRQNGRVTRLGNIGYTRSGMAGLPLLAAMTVTAGFAYGMYDNPYKDATTLISPRVDYTAEMFLSVVSIGSFDLLSNLADKAQETKSGSLELPGTFAIEAEYMMPERYDPIVTQAPY